MTTLVCRIAVVFVGEIAGMVDAEGAGADRCRLGHLRHLEPAASGIGAVLFGGINAVQFRMQAAGTTIPAAFLGRLPCAFTVLVLVIITWGEAFSKRVGAPAALGLPYAREEKG